jgi:NTF2 fold immunity protein
MNKMKTFIQGLTLMMVILPFFCCGQNFKGRTMRGEQNAKQAIKEALANKNNKPFYDTLIKDKETAIAVAEPILFKIYGKKNITDQKPYECYLLDVYWYICGTLPKGWRGGVFEIIISSKDGKIIKLIHGK